MMSDSDQTPAPYLPTLPGTSFHSYPNDAAKPEVGPSIEGHGWRMFNTFGHGELEELVWRILAILEQAGNGWQAICVQDLLASLAGEASRARVGNHDVVVDTLLGFGEVRVNDMYDQITAMVGREELGYFSKGSGEDRRDFVYITTEFAQRIDAFRH